MVKVYGTDETIIGKMSAPAQPHSIEQAIVAAMERCAPLYEAESVLKNWLKANGAIYEGNATQGYILLDQRRGHAGVVLGRRDTYNEILIFALDSVKQFILEKAQKGQITDEDDNSDQTK